MINLGFPNSVAVIVALMWSQFTSGQPQVVDKVVAVVGEHIVLLSDIEQQLDQLSQSELKVTENSRCEILENMMYQKLFAQRAKADSLEVTEDQVNQELNRRLRYFISQVGSEEELVKFYGKSIDEIKEEFKSDIEEILIVQQMQQKVIGEVKASPAEVREFYASIPKDSLPFINSQVRIAQIVRQPPPGKAEIDDAINKLRSFRKRVEAGEDFGTLAYLYSMDPGSAEKNGELGYTDRSDLVMEFANAATGLQIGEMSDVVKTEFGYHLIQMIDRRGDRINVRHILVIPQVDPMQLRQSKLFLDSLRTQILTTDSISFSKAASKYSTDKLSRMAGGEILNPVDGTNLFEYEVLGQVDRNLLFTVQRLKLGEISTPELFMTQEGKKAYRIVKLLEVTEPHIANLKDDYHRLQEAAKREKENRKLEDWIQRNCAKAYIWVDPEFVSCPFETHWTIAER